MSVEVVRIDAASWERLRALRLESLRESPQAFGGTFESEAQRSELEWRHAIEHLTYLVVTQEGADLAFMSVENLEGDFGATCWIGGCWTRPEQRGRGHLGRLVSYVDEHARDEGWTVQGLGVWTHNTTAIAAYERLGFQKRGRRRTSSTHPGWSYQRMFRRAALLG